MKPSFFLIILMVMVLSLSACGGEEAEPTAAGALAPTITPEPAPTDTPQPTETSQPVPTLIPTATAAPPTATATGTAEPTAPPAAAPELIEEEEAILILAPGNTSRITSPVTVRGEADPTFEQTLVVRIVTIEGETLVTEPATIAADLGERGPFEVAVPFSVQEDVQGWVQVLATSARDGGVTHLSSVGVMLAPEGPADIVEATPHPERIVVDSPAAGDTVRGGVLQVSGRGLASFEQTLIVELLDESGDVLVMEPVTVAAPDLGQPGAFETEISYSIDAAMPARLQVRDPSPAFGGNVHVASVEISLEP